MKETKIIYKPESLLDISTVKSRINNSLFAISNRYEELKKNTPELSLDDILKLLNDNEQEAKIRN